MRITVLIALLAAVIATSAAPSPGPIQHNPFTVTTNDPSVTVAATQPVSITTTSAISLEADNLIAFTNTINGRINVKSFDATIGNGGDDWAKLQNAVNHLPPRKALYLPSGEYLLSQTLVLSNNICIEGDGVSQEYQFALFGTNAPFYGTLSQTVLRPYGGPKDNFTLIQVTNTVSTSPAVVLRNLVFYGGDGICAFPGASTNTTGYGGTNKDFTVTFTKTNSTAMDFYVGGFGLLAQDCVAIGWSGTGFKLGSGSRLINSYASLNGVCAEHLGTDIYNINPTYHHAKNGVFLGSRLNLGDPADIYANWNHLEGGRIEWMEDFGCYFKAGEQSVVTPEFDRSGYANFASDNPFSRYNIIFGEFKRGGCFWRGIDPTNIPTASRIQAATLFLKNCGESWIGGVNRMLNSQDNGTGVIVPPIGAVLDNARDSHYLMSGAFDEVTHVSIVITNDQNNLTLSQPGRMTLYDANGVRYLHDNGSNALVSLHQFTAPYVASTGTNDPQLLVVDSWTNINGVLRFTEQGTNVIMDIRKGADKALQIIKYPSSSTILNADTNLTTIAPALALEPFTTNTFSQMVFRELTLSGTNLIPHDLWGWGNFTNNQFGLYDPVATNFVFSTYTGQPVTFEQTIAIPLSKMILLGTNQLYCVGTNLIFNGGTVNVTY